MFPFSFIKNKPLDTNLYPTKDYLNSAQTVKHGDDLGDTTGTQLFVVKTIANNGNLNISIVPNNGQTLIVAFSFSQQSILNWVQSAGVSVANLTTETITDGTYVKTIDNKNTDQYVWYAVSESGNTGTPATNPNNTYTITYSGNFTSPEALLKSDGVPGPPATGTYLNPVIIQPNSSVVYNSSYGQCDKGMYYFTFQTVANIPRNMTITTTNLSNFGIVYASSKNQIRDWVQAGGSGTLTDGGSITSTNGIANLSVELITNQSMFLAFYDSSNIGVNSCVGGKEFTLVSVQETESGYSNGTYANPVFIGNNVLEADAQTYTRSGGECRYGGFYYSVNTCTNTNIVITSNNPDMANLGIGISQSKANIANFLRTGNRGYLEQYAEMPNGLNPSMTVYAATWAYFIVIYDPDAIGQNCCTSTDTFKIWTQQLNCAGGGSGRDGRYNTPYIWNTSWYNVMHADGDCDVDGKVWFYPSVNCGRAPLEVNIQGNQWQPIGVAWSTDQAAVKTIIDQYNSGGQSTNCGSFDMPWDILNSNFTSYDSTFYQNVAHNRWNDPNTMGNILIHQLPSYCPTYEQCGSFDDQWNESNSSFLDANGYYYTNIGPDMWLDYDGVTIEGKTNLPTYCPQGGGGGQGWPSTSQLNPLDQVSWLISDGNGSVNGISSNENINQNIYLAVFVPNQGTANQCTNLNTFNLYVNNYYDCNYYLTGTYGGYYGEQTDPYVISNNITNKAIPYSAGACNSGDFYMQGYICQNNLFSMSISSTQMGTIAWSDSLQALIDWKSAGMVQNIQDYGATEAGFNTDGNFTFVPLTTAIYYFLFTTQNYSCSNGESFYLTTSQSGCNGAGVGTYGSPIGLTPSVSQVSQLSDGECFDNRIYYSLQLCAGDPASLTITQGSASHLQGYMWGPDLAFLQENLNHLLNEGWFYGVNDGGYQVDVYDSNPLTINFGSSDAIRNLYLVVFESGTSSGGYPLKTGPRCGLTYTVSLMLTQNCPIVNVGGTAGASGAKRYNYDPFDVLSISQKSGVALVSGDPNSLISASLLYSPLLALDDASSYPQVTCTGISATLFTNTVVGLTQASQEKTTHNVKVITDQGRNQIFIKPMVGSEFSFTNASLYTGLLRTTFATNVGLFVRNQIVNGGDSFTNGRSQYAYNISQVGDEITLVIPTVDEYAHTIVTSGGQFSSSYTFDKYNTVKLSLTPKPPTNTTLEIPFKSANSNVVKITKVVVK